MAPKQMNRLQVCPKTPAMLRVTQKNKKTGPLLTKNWPGRIPKLQKPLVVLKFLSPLLILKEKQETQIQKYQIKPQKSREENQILLLFLSPWGTSGFIFPIRSPFVFGPLEPNFSVCYFWVPPGCLLGMSAEMSHISGWVLLHSVCFENTSFSIHHGWLIYPFTALEKRGKMRLSCAVWEMAQSECLTWPEARLFYLFHLTISA